MRIPVFNRIILAAAFTSLIVLVLVNVLGAYAAANTVPVTRLDQLTNAVLISQLLPAGCAGMSITNIVYCTGGNCQGSNANNLILGTAGNDTIKAKGGGDCIVAGGGNDTVNGGNGGDTCIEGPGNDNYNSCTVVNP